jgi:hypothetical protein
LRLLFVGTLPILPMSDAYDHLIFPENDDLAVSESRMSRNQSSEECPTTQPEVLDEILIFIYIA